MRLTGSKQTSSPESPTVTDAPQHQSSDDDFSFRRKKQGKGVHRKKVLNKSQPSHVFPLSLSSESSEESGKELRKRTRVPNNGDAAQKQTKHKQRKSTDTSPPAKALPARSSRKHKEKKGKPLIPQEQDDDKWTEEELMKLQE